MGECLSNYLQINIASLGDGRGSEGDTIATRNPLQGEWIAGGSGLEAVTSVLTAVRHLLGALAFQGSSVSTSVSVSVFLGVVWVRHYFVRLLALAVGQQLLDSHDDGQHKGDLANDESLECEQGKSTNSQWDEGEGFHLQ